MNPISFWLLVLAVFLLIVALGMLHNRLKATAEPPKEFNGYNATEYEYTKSPIDKGEATQTGKAGDML